MQSCGRFGQDVCLGCMTLLGFHGKSFCYWTTRVVNTRMPRRFAGGLVDEAGRLEHHRLLQFWMSDEGTHAQLLGCCWRMLEDKQ